MKLIFFLIAFLLLSIRYYFSWTGKDRERRGLSESNIVIKSDNYYEEINYWENFKYRMMNPVSNPFLPEAILNSG